MEFFLGIGMGVVISLCFSFGPAFFTLLQLSLRHGFRNALPFVFGVNFDDIVIVLLLLTVLMNVDMEAVLHNPWIATIGGVVLISMGVYTFTRKASEVEEGSQPRVRFQPKGEARPFNYWLRGFFINFLNPAIWLYWLSIVSLAGGKFGVGGKALFPYFAGVLVTTLTLDVLKCKGASMLQRFLTARCLTFINRLVGLVLAAIGAYLIISMLLEK